MKSHLRWMVVFSVTLVLGCWSLAAGGPAEKEVMDKVQELAKALQTKQGNPAALVKDISGKLKRIELAKKAEDQGNELVPLMKIFSLKKRGGLGIGEKVADKDGLEAQMQALGEKPLSDKDLKDSQAAIIKLAYINAAIAEVIKTHPPAKFDAKKGQKKADWDKWSVEMGKLAEEMVKAAKKDPKAFNAAAHKADKNCMACHEKFRFAD